MTSLVLSHGSTVPRFHGWLETKSTSCCTSKSKQGNMGRVLGRVTIVEDPHHTGGKPIPLGKFLPWVLKRNRSLHGFACFVLGNFTSGFHSRLLRPPSGCFQVSCGVQLPSLILLQWRLVRRACSWQACSNPLRRLPSNPGSLPLGLDIQPSSQYNFS